MTYMVEAGPRKTDDAARVVDLTARVVLEEALRSVTRRSETDRETWTIFHESQDPDFMFHIEGERSKDGRECPICAVLSSSTPTPGSAWRAMVAALEQSEMTFKSLAENHSGLSSIQNWDAPTMVRAALAAARAVMGNEER